MKQSIVCALLVGAMSSLTMSKMQLSFDTLFPEAASKQLHDTMLQLWSDLTLLHDDSISDQQKRDLFDLVGGQLARIGYLIKHMQTKNNMLNHEDIAYFESIALGLSNTFSAFFEQKQVQSLWQNILNGFVALQGGKSNGLVE